MFQSGKKGKSGKRGPRGLPGPNGLHGLEINQFIQLFKELDNKKNFSIFKMKSTLYWSVCSIH